MVLAQPQSGNKMVTEKKSPRGNRVYKLRESSKHYTLRKQIKGKARFFNLGSDVRQACKMADQIDAYLIFNSYEDTLAHFYPNKYQKNNTPTIEELITRFEKSADLLDLKPRTITDYGNGLRKLVRGGGFKTSTNCLIDWAGCFNSYRRKMMHGLEEEDEILSKKRTINSVLRNAKSIVSEDALPYYTNWDMGWIVDLKKLKGYKKVAVHYTLPDEKLIKTTHEYLENLKCNFKFTMLALALHAGMRRGEIAHCRREWFDLSGDNENTIAIKSDRNFVPKTGHGGTTMLKSGWAQRIYARADGIDYLLPGIDRKNQNSIDDAFEPILKDLRSIGWKRQSPLHECRKLYGAFLATTDSLYKAQKCLRHTSPQITSDSYADIIVSDTVKRLWA